MEQQKGKNVNVYNKTPPRWYVQYIFAIKKSCFYMFKILNNIFYLQLFAPHSEKLYLRFYWSLTSTFASKMWQNGWRRRSCMLGNKNLNRFLRTHLIALRFSIFNPLSYPKLKAEDESKKCNMCIEQHEKSLHPD